MERSKAEGDFRCRLKVHLDCVRLRILEQIHGARLLENADCLGEETERIFADLLKANLPGDVRVFRGGHVYDYGGNLRPRSISSLRLPTPSVFAHRKPKTGSTTH